MSYSNLMRNAAKILFWIAVVLFVGTLVVGVVVTNRVGEPAAFLAGIAGAFSAAVTPFIGAAILWRIDLWLFERGDRS